jgi:NADPH-dependent 2,4-dienoyl-CoA reductase/sulfur reductase-like enzyme/rhodanese-related sulfurtransferase
MDDISAWIQDKQVKHCVVAGAGFVGLEMVEQLVRKNIKVTLVEMASQVLGPLDPEMAAILHKECEKHGVEVIVGDGIVKFSPADDGEKDVASVLELQSGRKIPKAEMTILGLGVKPDTLIAKEAGLEIAPRGHIVVDDQLKTSVPHIWAVGDSVLVRNPILSRDGKEVTWAVPLAGPANRQGRMVADIIYGRQRRYKGTYGASVVRVFGYVAACVGINEKMLKAEGLPFSVVHVHPGSHAGYFPGAKSINLKLMFDPNDGHIYGASAVGEDGVEKRIDIISTAIQGNMTVHDLADLELCYAPPVGSAKDPVNIAGMAAQNVVDGLVKQIDWKELKELQDHPDTDVVVIDVRNPGEVKNGVLVPNAINIPLNNLRERMHEIPKDKHVILSCQSGQRAYYAYRILAENGYDNIRNLSGAYKTYSAVQ